MNKYNLIICLITAISGKLLAADSQDNALSTHFRGRAVEYAQTIDADTTPPSVKAFFQVELGKAQAKVDLYNLPLDKIADMLNVLVAPCIQGMRDDPQHGQYYGVQLQVKSLAHFLNCEIEDGKVRISFPGREEFRSSHAHIQPLWLDLVNRLSAHCPNVVKDVRCDMDMDLVSNVVMLPFLCRVGNMARTITIEAKRQEDVQNAIAVGNLENIAVAEKAIAARNVAQQEQTFLRPLVEKFEEVISALKAAGRMS
jgi:hypothetical protein